MQDLVSGLSKTNTGTCTIFSKCSLLCSFYTMDELTLPVHYRYADYLESDMSTTHTPMEITGKPHSVCCCD